MGRRSRKRIPRTEVKEEVVEDFNEDANFLEAMKEEEEMNRTENILKIRDDMLQYRKDTGYPLCEYLTPEIMLDFINWLNDNITHI